MLFCRVRDAPAGNNAAKCILLHNYIHTSAIISYSSAINTLIQGQNYIASIYFSSLLTPSCNTSLISSPPPRSPTARPCSQHSQNRLVAQDLHWVPQDPVGPSPNAILKYTAPITFIWQVTNLRVNNVKYNKHTPSTTLFDYKQFVSLPWGLTCYSHRTAKLIQTSNENMSGEQREKRESINRSNSSVPGSHSTRDLPHFWLLTW